MPAKRQIHSRKRGPGRPSEYEEGTEPVTVYVPRSWLEAIQKDRGLVSKSAYYRELLREGLVRRKAIPPNAK